MSGEVKPSRLGEWIDQRIGWRQLMHEGLNEPIPGGSRWADVFGSGLLFIFINQIVTGVALSLYYVPSADHAHTSVSFIHKEVTAGAFIRSLHSYGSSVMVVVLLLHLFQTYAYGAYKSRRELVWLFGCTLFLLVLGMSFTGYLLPWDQKAYSATAVATNMLSEVPGIGNGLKTLMRGGTEMGTITISRFFTLHVFVVPALIVGAVAGHVFLFRRAGAAGPPVRAEERDKLIPEPYFPKQVFKDFVFGIAVIGLLSVLASQWPAGIGPKANPADPTYLPRPEWYYVPVFQWIKYWHGPASVVGIVLIPAALFLALFALPFVDRAPERRPWRRPFAMGSLIAVFGGLIFLGARSRAEDREDDAVRTKLLAQTEAEQRFAMRPFEPEESSTGMCTAGPRRLSAQESKGALLFVNESCAGCHGKEGKGGAGLYQLADRSQTPSDELKSLMLKPTAEMLAGSMEPSELASEDLDALVAYMRAVSANKEQ